MTYGIRILPQADLDGGAQCRIEIDDAILDEIVIKDTNDRCWFHMEQMDAGEFTLSIHGKNGIQFMLRRNRDGSGVTMERIDD